ncbi:MAG: siphovirus ReqiPepy6 Gp37-like family protein, partial [Ruminococcus sp.]|nr:siphovirus ReqiPepy6 Gp37-like family protein [Ruminococcus sp.]
MDLIYADSSREDIGILNEYSFDMAYGSDENNFECTIDRNEHCCHEGYFLYVENEEYGGIIDEIKVDTNKEEITYIGRTWHGILESKVICPDEGQDYAVFDGEANTVLRQIVDMLNLSSLFVVSSEISCIEISGYQMDRYITGYSGIMKMLKAFDAKLYIRWSNGMVELSATERYDYSQDEEFDASQVDFIIKKNFNPVNHIICLGQGNLKDRAVIHVFTDENGG